MITANKKRKGLCNWRFYGFKKKKLRQSEKRILSL